MARILLAGIDPALVDFSAPGLPPGFSAQFILDGLEAAKRDLTAQGHTVAHTFVPSDADALHPFASDLATGAYDAVVIGGGVRHPPENLGLFEAMLNLIARTPSLPAIVIVDHPGEAAEAVGRARERLSRYPSA